ncbi:hypothetical protein FQN60_014887 [Etheostoma spectabile]|uniref:protein-tyrosine-phosphatase n=1 Tax=Etheostoma spectabile TaxID=54343 RepID=A0A5J5CRY7_9PERO|nr:hypothetical protein FQN60_014887 [Etheostoma spectabile]
MVLFLIGISNAVNNSSHENQTAETPTHQGAHVLPSTLVISLLLIIVVLLTIYCLSMRVSVSGQGIWVGVVLKQAVSIGLWVNSCILTLPWTSGFKNHRKALVTSVDKKIPNGFLEEQGEQTVVLLPRSPSPSKRYFPIPLDSLEEEYRIRSADDGKLFREEFNSLPCYYHHGSFEEASREHNREKNRYPNILPYDHSRVFLSHLDGHPCSDYINASYIDGFKEKNKFIAAQGPKLETVADFWRMVWEQKTATIVMLTNLKERKEFKKNNFFIVSEQDKCYQYWPEKGCWMYGNIRVAMEDFTVLVDYTIRKFCVQYQGSDGPRAPRLVTQLHFTSWPDFGVPFSPIGMLKFLKKVKAVNPSYAGPIVVHCSAGVGRTGTFIVIDSMIDMMHMEQRVDVFGSVSRIREQRCQLIQTDMQYSFIYQALLEYYLYGDTELDVCSLEGHLQRLRNTRAPNDRLGLEEEFRKLTNVRIMKENMRTGNLPANMKKNRVLQIIPYDFNRVILSVKRGQEFTDYINASFIDEKCFQYWPSEGSVTFGDYTVELTGDAQCETFTLKDMVLTYRPEKQSQHVRHFHFHGWPEIGIPAEGRGMIDIIAAVQRQQQQSGNRPIIVHCSAGAGRTGTFIALSNILERVKAEGLLDVFQTVKSLRMQRPHMVQTVEQYDFCYRVVQDFVDIFSDYANFK